MRIANWLTNSKKWPLPVRQEGRRIIIENQDFIWVWLQLAIVVMSLKSINTSLLIKPTLIHSNTLVDMLCGAEKEIQLLVISRVDWYMYLRAMTFLQSRKNEKRTRHLCSFLWWSRRICSCIFRALFLHVLIADSFNTGVERQRARCSWHGRWIAAGADFAVDSVLIIPGPCFELICAPPVVLLPAEQI